MQFKPERVEDRRHRHIEGRKRECHETGKGGKQANTDAETIRMAQRCVKKKRSRHQCTAGGEERKCIVRTDQREPAELNSAESHVGKFSDYSGKEERSAETAEKIKSD